MKTKKQIELTSTATARAAVPLLAVATAIIPVRMRCRSSSRTDGLVIYKIYNGYWFFGRPTLEDLRQDLRAVTKKCRPDWDFTTPEFKAARQQGHRELFYPYGKTYVQTLGEQD